MIVVLASARENSQCAAQVVYNRQSATGSLRGVRLPCGCPSASLPGGPQQACRLSGARGRNEIINAPRPPAPSGHCRSESRAPVGRPLADQPVQRQAHWQLASFVALLLDFNLALRAPPARRQRVTGATCRWVASAARQWATAGQLSSQTRPAARDAPLETAAGRNLQRLQPLGRLQGSSAAQ